jgi:hypothetical protein
MSSASLSDSTLPFSIDTFLEFGAGKPPGNPLYRTYSCVPAVEKTEEYMLCRKQTGAPGPKSVQVQIGIQWPETLDQILLSTKLGAKVAIQ